MRFRMKVPQPATTVETVIRVDCDLCGEVMQPFDDTVGRLAAPKYNDTVYIGRSYDDGMMTVDCCGHCFDTKLLPWLRGQGAVLEVRKD